MQRNLSAAISFLDVRTAFAAMLRHFILPSDVTDPQLFFVSRIVSLGFSSDDARDIFKQAAQAKHWKTAGGSEHLHQVFEKTCTRTHGPPLKAFLGSTLPTRAPWLAPP